MPFQVTSKFYDINDQQKIVDYIIEKNEYFGLRGNSVWRKIEDLKVCPGRSWQSLKQHFQTKIINSLETLNISETERNRILKCYHYTYKFKKDAEPVKRISCVENDEDPVHYTPRKRKTRNFDEDPVYYTPKKRKTRNFVEDPDTPKKRKTRNFDEDPDTPKKRKTRNFDEDPDTSKKRKTRNSDVENETTNSPKVRVGILESNRIITQAPMKVTQAHKNFNIESMNVDQAYENVCDNIGSDQITNLSLVINAGEKNESESLPKEEYSDEEDRNIIVYIKENMNWTDLQYFDEIYENCQKEVLIKRSSTSIKNRFLNVILPNLYAYHIVDIEELPLFYDRAGVNIPLEVEQIFCDLTENIDSNRSKESNSITTANNICASKRNDTDHINENHVVENNQNIAIEHENASNKFTNISKNGYPREDCISKTGNLKNIESENVLALNHENSDNFISHDERFVHNEKINVGVQTVDNFKFQFQSANGQLCLNIDNKKYIFISGSINNSKINVINHKHGHDTTNILMVNKKSFEDLKKFKKLNDKLEKKILNLKDKNLEKCGEYKISSLNFEKSQSLRLTCSCMLQKSKQPDGLVGKKKSRIIQLPIPRTNCKKIKHFEDIYTGPQIKKKNTLHGNYKGKEKKKGKLHEIADKELISINNAQDKKCDSPCKNIVTIMEEDLISDYSSPIISTSRTNEININDKMCKKIKLCGEISAGNILANNASDDILKSIEEQKACNENAFDREDLNKKIIDFVIKNEDFQLQNLPEANEESNSTSVAFSFQSDFTCNDLQNTKNSYGGNILLSKKVKNLLKEKNFQNPQAGVICHSKSSSTKFTSVKKWF